MGVDGAHVATLAASDEAEQATKAFDARARLRFPSRLHSPTLVARLCSAALAVFRACRAEAPMPHSRMLCTLRHSYTAVPSEIPRYSLWLGTADDALRCCKALEAPRPIPRRFSSQASIRYKATPSAPPAFHPPALSLPLALALPPPPLALRLPQWHRLHAHARTHRTDRRGGQGSTGR